MAYRSSEEAKRNQQNHLKEVAALEAARDRIHDTTGSVRHFVGDDPEDRFLLARSMRDDMA